MTNLLLSSKGRMYAFGIMYLSEGIPYGKDPDVQKNELHHQFGALTRFLNTFRQFLRNLYTGFMESGSGPKVGILFALLPVGCNGAVQYRD
jgi:hypothetical protein